MPLWLKRAAIWGPLFLAAALAVAYYLIHRPGAPDGPDLLTVALSEQEPSLSQVGDLDFMGGIDIPRSGIDLGGLSGLRWDEYGGHLVALADDARWAVLDPVEPDGLLQSVDITASGELTGLSGETLTGKEAGDSEGLTRSREGGWLVSFERSHRVWRYPALDQRPVPTRIDPAALFGELGDNQGLETLAGDEDDLLACAERQPLGANGNCRRLMKETKTQSLSLLPPNSLMELGAVPTDGDRASDGTFYVLFRSYSPTDGNTAAITALAPDGTRRDLAVLRAPLTVDNFEGLAVREDAGRTFLYIVSDDNFSGSQRTLLMKFEVPGGP